MIIPPIGLCSRKLDATPKARIAAYSDGDGTCKHNASRQAVVSATMQAMRQLLET
jgi:hypothetical protein